MLQERKSLFWPLLLSVFFIHGPLVLWFLFADWNKTLVEQMQKEIVAQSLPLMMDLNSLPLIDVDKPSVENMPDQPSAVAQYNIKTDVETVQNPTPGKKEPAQKQKPKPPQVKKPTPSQDLPDTPKSDPSLPKNLKEMLAKLDLEQKNSESKFNELFKSKTPASQVDFKTSLEPSGDYAPHFKVGNRTYVNAMAYPHVAYYVEMKRKFRTAWNPLPTLSGKMHLLPPNQIEVVYGFTIDAKGNIIAMQLIQASPIAEYDDEAKRTIRASAPFSPPPAELLKGASTLDVAWMFYVYY